MIVSKTLRQWQRLITRRVIVEGEISTGELCELLADMWADAERVGWRWKDACNAEEFEK